VPYCTEACIWTPELGLDAVICGPGDPGMAHQPDEHVPVEQVELAARVYARTLARLLLEEE
jgi:acetylornithine deacetylase/succinyl-diaminopimelate desuccinylase-like protein